MPPMRPIRPRPLRPAAAAAASALPGAIAAPPMRGDASSRAAVRARARSLPRPRPELALLVVLAGVLNLWALSRNGWANEYYSAAVRSMTQSWHNFLYASFDAAGVMTVDKPPLALWVQAAAAKAFGFHSLSLLVPQALMGVASVALVHDLTRRRFGRAAGFVAGLALATTPITVAISRHNNPDALLVLCCVAALWLVARAFEDGRTRWLVLAGVAVGLGFETKMAAALMVVPGIAAAWLWVAPRGRRVALGQLVAGGAAMVAVAGAWPLLMILTPAGDRPWVSGTSDDSVVSLILGYNGLGRIAGQAGGPQALGGGGGGGGVFGGPTGPLRLLDASLGGQAGWLLGFALVAGVAVLVATRLRRTDPRTGWLIAVGGAFLTSAVAFSYASGIFHPYYVSLLAPFTAALVGTGAAQLLDGGRAVRVIAPAAVAAGVAAELVVLYNNPGELAWLAPVLVAVGAVTAVALAVRVAPRVRAVALAAVLAVLLAAPGVWAVQTLGHATSGTFPAGGPVATGLAGGEPGGPGGAPGTRRAGAFAPGRRPAGAGGPAGGGPAAGMRGGAGGFGADSTALTSALAYVRRHGGGTIAVPSQSGASHTIIASGADVAAIGGFSGRESEVSVAWLADAVRSGRIRWVLTGGDGPGGGRLGRDGRVGSSAVMAAVAQTCTPVSTSGATSTAGGTSATASATLYDCRGEAGALASAAAS